MVDIAISSNFSNSWRKWLPALQVFANSPSLAPFTYLACLRPFYLQSLLKYGYQKTIPLSGVLACVARMLQEEEDMKDEVSDH